MKSLSKYTFIPILFIIIAFQYACDKKVDCLLPEGGCNCPDGYEGENCDIAVTAKFLGNYSLTANDTSKMVLKSSADGVRQILINNYYSSSFLLRGIRANFVGIVEGTHITIPRQIPTQIYNTKLVEGDGCIETIDNRKRIVFNLRFDGSPYITRTLFYSY